MNSMNDPLDLLAQVLSDFLRSLLMFAVDFARQLLAAFLL